MRILAGLFILLSACSRGGSKIESSYLGGIDRSSSLSTVSVAQASIVAGGTTVVTVRVNDQNGNPFYVPGREPVVALSLNGGTSDGTFGAVTDLKNGTYTSVFTSTVAGTAANVSAAIDGWAVSSTASVTVVAGVFSAANSYVTLSSASVNSSSSVTATLHLFDATNNPIHAGGLAVTFGHVGGTSDGTFSAVTDHGDGTYTADFTGTTAGSATTITATIAGVAVTHAAPSVTVSNGPPTQLLFSSQPVGGVAPGVALATQPVVTLKDANNNLVSSGAGATAGVTLSLTTGTGTLGGTLTVAAVAGVATFTNISVSAQGTGKILTATLSSITAASNSFDINPPAPGSFTISSVVPGASAGQAVVTWGASGNAASYTLKYGTVSGIYGTTVSTSATSPTTVTGLTAGTTYYFMVTATNVTGSTNAGAEVSGAVYQTFALNIPFTNGTGASYSNAGANLEIAGNLLRLKAADQTDNDNATTHFASTSAAPNGVTWDATLSALRLNTTTNNAELDSSWTPEWGNLVSYWKMNEVATSTTITDQTSAANTGSVVGGVTFGGAGKLNTAATFNGSSGQISMGNKTSLKPAFPFTVAAWIKMSALPATQTAIVSSPDTVTNFTYAGYTVAITSTGAVTSQIGNNGGNCAGNFRRTFNSPDGVIALGKWYHVAVVFAAAGNQIIYLNGVPVTSGNSGSATSIAYAVNNSFRIGYFPKPAAGCSTPDGYFNGVIDELALWKTGLTDAQVALLYDRQAASVAGTFTSRPMDAYVTGQSWKTLSAITTLPFYKELPAASEAIADYASLDANLLTSISAFWHLDEPSWNGTASEVVDASGKGMHGARTGTATTSAYGKFARGGSFAAVTDGVVTGASSNFIASANHALTFSAWINPSAISSTTTAMNNRIFTIHAGAVAGAALGFGLGNSNKLMLYNGADATTTSSTTVIPLNAWTHVAATYSGTCYQLYVNGKTDGSCVAKSLSAGGTFAAYLGSYDGTTNNFSGTLDEVALWGRSLSAGEVTKLYRRGANRLKYQVRSCTALDCSDQEALTGTGRGWKGPDNSFTSYFSELYNTTGNALGAAVAAGSPLMTFANFGGFALTANRYFQYRAIFESDDANSLCSYGACSPELSAVTAGPVHYDSAAQSIQSNASIGVAYRTFDSNGLTESLGGNACTAGVKYALSSDGVAYYYWSGSAWTASSSYLTASDAATIRANIATFPSSTAGVGTLQVQTYLKSDGTSPCEVDNLLFTGLKY